MTAEGERVFIGGLYRCCTETLRERTAPGVDGERQPCKHCDSGAVFESQVLADGTTGFWRWDRSEVTHG